MFPSYKSRADKVRKTQEFLDRIKRDQKIDAIKQEAYKNAFWASEAESKMILPNQKPIAQLQSMGTQTPPIKTILTVKHQTSPIQTNLVETRNRYGLLSSDDEEDNPEEKISIDANKIAREDIIQLYKSNWNFFKTRKISPLLLTGYEDTTIYLGRTAKLFTTGTVNKNKNKRITDYDWIATRDKIDRIIEENRQLNAINQGINRMRVESDSNVKVEREAKGFNLSRPRRPFDTNGTRVRGKLIGRGLIGAGTPHQFDKEYMYRPIGCKHINLKSLADGYLSLRHPSGNSCFKRIKMSDKLIQIIKTLIFDGHIDHTMYSQLDQGDKCIFYDTMKLCKLLHAFKESIADPRGDTTQYVAEFNKLVGELQLGNDNPSIKSELKRMSIYLYQNGILSEKHFNEIIRLTV
jgi:hypothetical protein